MTKDRHWTEGPAWEGILRLAREKGAPPSLSHADGHLNRDELAKYIGTLALTGEESPEERAEKTHVMTCAQCLSELSALAQAPVPVEVEAPARQPVVERTGDVWRIALKALEGLLQDAAGGRLLQPVPILVRGPSPPVVRGAGPKDAELDGVTITPAEGVRCSQTASGTYEIETREFRISLRDDPDDDQPGVRAEVKWLASDTPKEGVGVTFTSAEGEVLGEPAKLSPVPVRGQWTVEHRFPGFSIAEVGDIALRRRS